jgi:hypothetical protein
MQALKEKKKKRGAVFQDKPNTVIYDNNRGDNMTTQHKP